MSVQDPIPGDLIPEDERPSLEYLRLVERLTLSALYGVPFYLLDEQYEHDTD